MPSLSVKLTLAFIVVAVVGLGVVALSTSVITAQEFEGYVGHMGGWQGPPGMQGMMGGQGLGGMMQAMGDVERQFLNSVNRALWLAAAVALGVAALLSWLLTRQITGPLRRLTAAAKLVAGGQLNHQVEIRSRDEIGELAAAFNTMASSLAKDTELRRQLLADVAHELRTPLTVLQGNLEAMRDGILPPTPEHLAILQEETELLSRLITDLRDLSLAEAGQLRLERVPVGVAELASNSLARVAAQGATKNIALVDEVPAGVPLVMADPHRVEQVLLNLLGNALRYTPEHGRITLGARWEPASVPMVTVFVSDTGPGIAPEDLPRVFDRFYRADKSRSRATGGSGIGLAIVRQLVHAHGGRVWAESQPGNGATFYFSLPVASQT